MKKIFTFAAVAISAIASFFSSEASAKLPYQGFVDANFGLSVSRTGFPEGYKMYKSGHEFTLLGTTTHGVRLNDSWFVGAGIGAVLYVTPDWKKGLENRDYENSFNVPVFIDGRWELSHGKKLTPFVDLKLGYSIRADKYRGINIMSPGAEFPDCASTPSGNFFVQPTAGVRLAVSDKIGLNLGLTYFPTRYKFSKHLGNSVYSDDILGHYTRNNLCLNVGVDF